MGAIYRGILDRIEAADYDVFSRVIRVPRPRRALIAATTWAQTAITGDTGSARHLNLANPAWHALPREIRSAPVECACELPSAILQMSQCLAVDLVVRSRLRCSGRRRRRRRTGGRDGAGRGRAARARARSARAARRPRHGVRAIARPASWSTTASTCCLAATARPSSCCGGSAPRATSASSRRSRCLTSTRRAPLGAALPGAAVAAAPARRRPRRGMRSAGESDWRRCALAGVCGRARCSRGASVAAAVRRTVETVAAWLDAPRPARTAARVAVGAAGGGGAEPVARTKRRPRRSCDVLARMFGPTATDAALVAAADAAARDVRAARRGATSRRSGGRSASTRSRACGSSAAAWPASTSAASRSTLSRVDRRRALVRAASRCSSGTSRRIAADHRRAPRRWRRSRSSRSISGTTAPVMDDAVRRPAGTRDAVGLRQAARVRRNGVAPVARRERRRRAGRAATTTRWSRSRRARSPRPFPARAARACSRGTVVREKRATFSLAPGQPPRPGVDDTRRGAVPRRRLD